MIVLIQPASSAKAPPSPAHFIPEEEWPAPLHLPLEQQYTPPGEEHLLVFNSPSSSEYSTPNDLPFPSQVPIKLSPKTLRENEIAVKEPKQGLLEVQHQLRKIFPSGPEYVPPGRWTEERRTGLHCEDYTNIH